MAYTERIRVREPYTVSVRAYTLLIDAGNLGSHVQHGVASTRLAPAVDREDGRESKGAVAAPAKFQERRSQEADVSLCGERLSPPDDYPHWRII